MMQAFWAVQSAGFSNVSEATDEDVRAVAEHVQVGVYRHRGGGYWMLIQHEGQRAYYEFATDEYVVRLLAYAALRDWTVKA